jgi:glycosyltransferase involved in cell wall biosynthesis
MAESAQRRPTRLLFIQTQAEAAGAQEITRLLAEQLSKPTPSGRHEFEAHHVFLYRKTGGCDHFPNAHFAADPRPEGLSQNLAMLWRLNKLVRSIEPDVMLTFQHFGNIVAAPVGRLLGVPLIIANHVSPQSTISRPVALVDKLLGLAGCYDEITVNSHATWLDYQGHPASYKHRLTYVPHGFADRTVSITQQEARARFGLPADVPIIGSVARLNAIKRIDLAIRLLPVMPDVHLALAGQGPEGTRLKDLGAELGVSGRLHFAGEMPSSEIGAFLKSLDVFVFPTSGETFGLAPVEAAQAGIPVVSSDISVMREVLQVRGEPCAVFVETTDIPAFAKAVRAVLSDPDLRRRLSECGQRLREQHSLDAMVDGYRRLIRREPKALGDKVQASEQLQK